MMFSLLFWLLFLIIKTNEGKVIIIGSGPSGIAAASKLAENGYTDFIILEAENRMGGRIHTITIDDKKIDLGAEWVHGQVNNVVYEMAAPLGILEEKVFDLKNFTFAHSSGQNINQEYINNIFDILKDVSSYINSNKITYGSKGDYFISEVSNRKNPTHQNYSSYLLLPEVSSAIDWYELAENGNDGSPCWYETEAPGPNNWEECPGVQSVIWKNAGYSSVYPILMKANADLIHKKIHLNKEVSRIYWGNETTDSSGTTANSGAIVRCIDGSVYEADHVIVTVSLGVLKERVHSLFRPSLPSNKLIAIKALGFGVVDKIYVQFDEAWWPPGTFGFAFLWNEEDRSNFTPPKESPAPIPSRHWLTEIIAFLPIDNHPNILCGWTLGPATKQMERASDQEVLEGSYFILNRFFGKQYNITKPIRVVRTSWDKNPHFRGSYSYRTVEANILKKDASDLAEPILHENKPVLLFAGEATNLHHFATVHGAIETGWREAERLLPYLGLSGMPEGGSNSTRET